MKFFTALLLGPLLASDLGAHTPKGVPSPSQEHSDYRPSQHQYRSSTVIQIAIPDWGLGGENGGLAFLNHFEEQKKAILSDENLGQAIKNLMPEAIGGHGAVIKFMKAELMVEVREGTDLLEIIVISGDARFSGDLANQITNGYVETQRGKDGQVGAIVHEKAKVGVLLEKKKEDGAEP